MPVYVGLLRGVNVANRNKLSMAELRECFVDMGFRAVSTYIQSGNVVFSASSVPDPRRLASAIHERFSVATEVVVRTHEQLAAAESRNPFSAREPSHLHVGFTGATPPPSELADLDVARFSPEECVILGGEIYLYLPKGMAVAKLPGYLARKLGVVTTIRNWNTVRRLVELSSTET